MDRPKQRRLILVVFVLLAGGALLLLDRPWTSAPNVAPAPADVLGGQVLERRPETVQPATVEAAAPSAPASPSPLPPATATGFWGRVIDASTHQPVTEFEVQLVRVRRDASAEDAPITRSFESRTGRFAWTDVAAGTWRAAVAAPGYQMFNVDDFQVSAGTATREFVMPLLRGFAVRGHVFELSTGTAIIDARISFQQAGVAETFSKSRAYAESKEDGSFTLDGIPGGDIVLTVGARDHAYHELAIVVDEYTPPQEIGLSAGGTIAGVVTTTAGVPIKGAVALEGPGPGYLGDTNDAGQFSYQHMRPGRYRVSVNTNVGSARQEFVLGQDEIKEVALIVGAGRSVRGTVVGLRPEQLQTTRLLLRTESESASLMGRPDEWGAYALTGVPPGRAVMTALGPSVRFDKTVEVPTDQDVTLDIVFPTGARLSGRVTQGGEPAAQKNVWMRPVEDESNTLYRTSTSGDGVYEIEGLSPGEYRLSVDEDIHRAITMAGDTVLDIDIPSVQLSARVVEDGASVPVVGANVYVRGSAPETARVRGDKQTDDFGQFAFTGIEPGEIVLMVYKPGYEIYRETIAYFSPITNRTIALRKDAGVEVRVQPGSRRFPQGFTITESFPGNGYVVDLWMPLDREGVGHVPSALAGTTLQIGRFSGKPIVIEQWDGQPFELP
jgi:hypothetical protein